MRWRKQERLLTSAALGIVYVSAGRQVLLEPLCLICHGLDPIEKLYSGLQKDRSWMEARSGPCNVSFSFYDAKPDKRLSDAN